MSQKTKLGLGGHSFIAALGSDPEASFDEQCAIVAACLDRGIRFLDTTYYQERVALGKVLQQLPGRRGEARITAWNFFRQAGRESELTGFTAYGPESLATQLAELQTEYLDLLVIHTTDDRGSLEHQIALANEWRAAGQVRTLGLGMARLEDLDRLPTGHGITTVLAPYSAFNTRAATLFGEAKVRGMTTVAMSPFVRGWNLDKLAEESTDREALAAHLLRWVTAQEIVDTVVVSMRRTEWVGANLAAEAEGALSDEEAAWVREQAARIR